MANKTRSPRRGEDLLLRRHRRFGWTTLFLWLAFGFTLEALLGFKASGLMLDPIRREFWKLAHFHGALLALVNLVYVAWANDDRLAPSFRRWASTGLLAGSTLLPAGFFLGGLVHYEGDPGLGIFLVPAGGLLILYAVGVHAAASWRR